MNPPIFITNKQIVRQAFLLVSLFLSPMSIWAEEDSQTRHGITEKLTSGFYVVLTSRRSETDAREAQSLFARQVEEPLFVRRVEVHGDEWFRVTTPFYKDQGKAREVMRQLPPRLGSIAWYINTSASEDQLAEAEESVDTVENPVWEEAGVTPLADLTRSTPTRGTQESDPIQALPAKGGRSDYPFDYFARLDDKSLARKTGEMAEQSIIPRRSKSAEAVLEEAAVSPGTSGTQAVHNDSAKRASESSEAEVSGIGGSLYPFKWFGRLASESP